jgi:hypothetical protein
MSALNGVIDVDNKIANQKCTLSEPLQLVADTGNGEWFGFA